MPDQVFEDPEHVFGFHVTWTVKIVHVGCESLVFHTLIEGEIGDLQVSLLK